MQAVLRMGVRRATVKVDGTIILNAGNAQLFMMRSSV